ncbi:MAG: hypothetical protein Q8L29_02245 [archaeon]|nr:hypothetical protein [archaeon]
MNKRGFFPAIVAVFVILVIGSMFMEIKIENDDKNDDVKECVINEDCVPETCCHATSCVPKEKQPNCEGIYCSQDCELGTLDCGQGSCECIENKCGVKLE